MKRLPAALIALLAAASPALALFSGSAGTSGGQFLRLPASARDAALGEAAVADERGPSALHYNPAALTSLSGSALGLLYASQLAGSSFGYASYARGGSQLAWAVSAKSLSYGRVVLRDSAGAVTGTTSPRDLAFGAGLAWKLGQASAGLSVQRVDSRLSASASAWTGGFGLQSGTFLDGRARLAISGDNLFGKLKFDLAGDPLPAVLRLGGAWRGEGFTALAELDASNDQKPYPAFGLEVPAGPLALRAGYTRRLAGGSLKGLAGFSAGLGLGFRSLDLDYALSPYGDLGSAHRLSLTLRF